MKKIFFVVILFLITLIIFNKIAKQYLEQTKYEQDDFIQNIKFVYGEKYQDYIKVYQQQSYPTLYTPLIEFRERKRDHEFVSISKYGNRCTENGIKKCEEPNGGKNEIWVFGGSTVFGYGLKNDETIAAHLKKYLKNKKIINFGQGHFHSTQSRIFFQNLLTFFPPPKTVIFLDGFNDFKINQINNYQFPIKTSLTRNFEDLINNKEISKIKKFRNWLKEKLNKLNIVRLYKEKTKQNISKNNNKLLIDDLDVTYKSLINRLRVNFKINKSVGKKFNTNVINILEPISLSSKNYSSSSIQKKYLKDFDKNFYHYKKIYALIEKNNELLNLVDINMINLNIKQNMFVDLTHYTSDFSKKIASDIFQKLHDKKFIGITSN